MAETVCMTEIDTAFLMQFLRLVAARLEENRSGLCILDGEIGDGDHGTSMANGFAAISGMLRQPGVPEKPPGAVLHAAAGAFLGDVGATVGPLYSSAMIEAGKAFGDRRSLAFDELGTFILAFSKGIASRGKAKLGDKTMLDAWIPAGHAAKLAERAGASPALVAKQAAQAAEAGALATATMIASRGRAALLRERSLGHQDPGAVSAAIIISALAEVVAHATQEPT